MKNRFWQVPNVLILKKHSKTDTYPVYDYLSNLAYCSIGACSISKLSQQIYREDTCVSVKKWILPLNGGIACGKNSPSCKGM